MTHLTFFFSCRHMAYCVGYIASQYITDCISEAPVETTVVVLYWLRERERWGVTPDV